MLTLMQYDLITFDLAAGRLSATATGSFFFLPDLFGFDLLGRDSNGLLFGFEVLPAQLDEHGENPDNNGTHELSSAGNLLVDPVADSRSQFLLGLVCLGIVCIGRVVHFGVHLGGVLEEGVTDHRTEDGIGQHHLGAIHDRRGDCPHLCDETHDSACADGLHGEKHFPHAFDGRRQGLLEKEEPRDLDEDTHGLQTGVCGQVVIFSSQLCPCDVV